MLPDRETLLVIDTATEACSVALFHDSELIASDHAVMGRGHAERLVPMIAALWWARPGGVLTITATMLLVAGARVLFGYSDVLHNSLLIRAAQEVAGVSAHGHLDDQRR